MQRTGVVPRPLLNIPNPCLRKGRGELPTDQRRLSVMSVWMFAWEAPAYRSLAEWRSHWTHPTSFGAVPHGTIGDVSTALATQVEHARTLALPLAGAALDRQKCFDYLVTDVCIILALHAECPPDIVAVRRNFYDRHVRYIRMGSAYMSDGPSPLLPFLRRRGGRKRRSTSSGDVRAGLSTARPSPPWSPKPNGMRFRQTRAIAGCSAKTPSSSTSRRPCPRTRCPNPFLDPRRNRRKETFGTSTRTLTANGGPTLPQTGPVQTKRTRCWPARATPSFTAPGTG